MTNLPAHRSEPPAPPAVVPMPSARTFYAYPSTPPPPPTLEETLHTAMDALAAAADLAARYRQLSPDNQAARYPCRVCGGELVHVPPVERARHFLRHTVADRAKVVGWFRAVMGQ